MDCDYLSGEVGAEQRAEVYCRKRGPGKGEAAGVAAQLQQTGQAVPAPVAGFALIDTGASVSAVDDAVIQQLGVQPIGMVPVGTAGGPQQQATYRTEAVYRRYAMVSPVDLKAAAGRLDSYKKRLQSEPST